jgi:hypothetical protein
MEDYPAARAAFAEALEIHRALRNRFDIGGRLNNLGLVCAYEGDAAAARGYLTEALTIAHGLRSRVEFRNSAWILAWAEHQEGRHTRAATLWGVAEALSERTGVPMIEDDVAREARLAAVSRKALGDAAFDAAYARGHGFTLDEAHAFAVLPAA